MISHFYVYIRYAEGRKAYDKKNRVEDVDVETDDTE